MMKMMQGGKGKQMMKMSGVKINYGADGKKIIPTNQRGDKISSHFVKKNGLKIPHLAAVLVGNDGASLTYVGSKVRSCEQVGFKSTLMDLKILLPASSSFKN